VDFRCDFPMCYSHSEIMIHGEIDSLRLTGLAATAWLCSELNAHRIVHRFAEQRLPGPGRIACPFDMHVATALTLRFATVRKLVSSRCDSWLTKRRPHPSVNAVQVDAPDSTRAP
jgi:hypothetical protein